MFAPDQYAADGLRAGCPPDQMENFIRAAIILQPRQLAASSAARLCDLTNGPTAIGYGGARGGGKSHWLLAQMGADDCQRVPGLKCLLLRKSGKSNLENFEDLRLRLFLCLKHSFNASRGILTFDNASRIIAKHYQHENEIDAFLGLEYDVIGIEEATTLSARKYSDIITCLRTSKNNWRPRLYSTTNPGGIGHAWYKTLFVDPHLARQHQDPQLSSLNFHLPPPHPSPTTPSLHHSISPLPPTTPPLQHSITPLPSTLFIPARVDDNQFTNPEYKTVLATRTGWQKDAWYHGRWDISAGQFFNNFRHHVHVIDHFDEARGVKWLAAMDYGYTHYTVVLLGCLDCDDNLFILDEHAERHWVPQRHILPIRAMFQRHQLVIGTSDSPDVRRLSRFVAGGDLFSHQFDGVTIASHYAKLGLSLRPANTNRVQGWVAILQRLGDPDAGIKPTLFIHRRCTRLLDCLPFLQHDPDQPADVLKTNPSEDGLGGDDAADALRYMVATHVPTIYQRKLTGL